MIRVTLESFGNESMHLPIKMTVNRVWRQSVGSKHCIGKGLDAGWTSRQRRSDSDGGRQKPSLTQSVESNSAISMKLSG